MPTQQVLFTDAKSERHYWSTNRKSWQLWWSWLTVTIGSDPTALRIESLHYEVPDKRLTLVVRETSGSLSQSSHIATVHPPKWPEAAA